LTYPGNIDVNSKGEIEEMAAGIFEDTNPRDLKGLLDQINRREAALPDFQRDFVWDPNATRELIISIANNYPAGSLLRIRNTNEYFACREFQEAPPLHGYRPTFLVLDGQQRLTSLYQAFYGLGDHRYYLDLKKLMDEPEFEEAVFHLRANVKRAQRYAEFEIQARELIMPLSVLKDGRGGFTTWARQVARTVTNIEERTQLEDKLDYVENNWIETIDKYEFPVVTLSDSTSADAVCTIFETLNRTGVRLSPFELLTARFWPKNVNLRQLWDQARADNPIIEDFEVDPYYLLQIVALASRSAPACTRKIVLDLEADTIREWWDRAVFGLAKGLELLRDDCGVITPNWLPYNTIVNPLGAILAKLALPGSPQVGANRYKLARWFWCAIFGQAYESAPNSQSAKDVLELGRWLEGGEPPEVVSRFQFDPRLLRDTTGRQRAVYRGTFCLVLRKGPRDFHSAAKLDGDLIIEQHVDDHHIFPNAYLARQGVPTRQRDCVLNRTLIDRKTNQRISDRAPSKYMTEIRDALGEEDFQKLLESHQLPHGWESPLWRDDFEGFLGWRQDALWRQIQEVTGVEEAADLIEEEISA
jgi:hypothetical protein